MRSGAGGDTWARHTPANAIVTSAAAAAATCLTPPTLTRGARQSHVNVSGSQVPLQQSESWPQLSPVCSPEAPPHVPSHVPQVPSQQSES